ncbi:MAG: GatB/YqeY domain-containing protein [Pyrinomonadaceae bacterium]
MIRRTNHLGGRKFMSLKQQIISDLTASMKAQDTARTSTLRMVKAGIVNREIEKGGGLDDDEMAKLLRSMVKQRKDSVEQFEKGARPELAAKEQAEIVVIEAYLPQGASQDEIEQAVAAAIAETDAASMKDMGKVMKAVQATLGGKNADGRTISEAVKAKLGSF